MLSDLMNEQDLVATLREMADLVEQGDSFEGSIEYLVPSMYDTINRGEWEALDDAHKSRWREGDPGRFEPAANYWMVRASYRVGNSMGQGGVRMFGRMEDEPLR